MLENSWSGQTIMDILEVALIWGPLIVQQSIFTILTDDVDIFN